MILLTPHLCVANFVDSMDDVSDEFALQLYAYNWNGTKFFFSFALCMSASNDELQLGGTWFFFLPLFQTKKNASVSFSMLELSLFDYISQVRSIVN